MTRCDSLVSFILLFAAPIISLAGPDYAFRDSDFELRNLFTVSPTLICAVAYSLMW